MAEYSDNNYEKKFAEYRAPKWLDIYCTIVHGIVFVLWFIKAIFDVCAIGKITSNLSFSMGLIIEIMANLAVIGVLGFIFLMGFMFSMIGSHYVDYFFRGKYKLLIMLSSIITIPGGLFVIILIASIFSGCTNSSIWGILDPRFQ